MRLGSVFFLVFLILAEILVLISLEPAAEAFVTIPAPVAFAIITAAVKLKLILVKIMFAMRTLGKFHIIRKREAQAQVPDYQNELIAAWTELEREAERPIHFDMESCMQAALAPEPTTTTQSPNPYRRRMDGWSPMVATTEAPDDDETIAIEEQHYSQAISSLIGSMTKNDEACKILQEGLISTGRDGMGPS